MIAAPLGLPGNELIGPFLRMAQGRNTLNEVNTSLGLIMHADGWGAVYDDEGRFAVTRSVRPCWNDPAFDALQHRRVYLLHARKASRGSVAMENTHPFVSVCGSGETWQFCHNGTVRDELPEAQAGEATGNTDSERMFHLLLPFVCSGDTLGGLRTVYGGFQDFTSLNTFLLGQSVFWAASRFSVNAQYFTLHVVDTSAGPVVSSEPLVEFGAGWLPMDNGSAVSIDRTTGKICTHIWAT